MCRMRDVIVMWIASALAWAPLHAQPAGEVLPAGLDRAVERGLNYLHGQQDAEKGSFRAAGPPNAMAGLAVLAFLGCGHTPHIGWEDCAGMRGRRKDPRGEARGQDESRRRRCRGQTAGGGRWRSDSRK